MIKLFDLPVRRARELCETGAVVWLTVNPVEYHGPHLSLHNDLLLSHGCLRDVHALLGAKAGPLVVADDLEIGVNPTPGPGSRFTPFAAASALIVEACARLCELGARKVVLMTFHGDPLHNLAIDAGVKALRARGVACLAPFNRLLGEMLELDGGQFAQALAHVSEPKRSAMLAALPFDFHAGFFETSLSLHYAPSSVDPGYSRLPECPEIADERAFVVASKAAALAGRKRLARELLFAAHAKGWHALRPFPGYTSAPALATAAAGAFFARVLCERFKDEVEGALWHGHEGPQPIMRWVERASLRGRLGV